MPDSHRVERRRARKFIADSPAWLARWARRWAEARTPADNDSLTREKRMHYDELARCIKTLKPNSSAPPWLEAERSLTGGQQ
jgi:hypothetical protein